MSKRPATEALEELHGLASPSSKRSRTHEAESPLEGNTIASTFHHGDSNGTAYKVDNGNDDDDDADDDDEFEGADVAPMTAPTRQSKAAAGYDDLYLDTIDRQVLDFDFEKLCSVSLSNINVYACLVCGRYFQGRGPKSHAYFHALDEDHHVYINLETQKVYVLPEGYEVQSKSLDDIKYVSDPRYTKQEVADLDRPAGATTTTTTTKRKSWTLTGKEYVPGFVGMNNIKGAYQQRFRRSLASRIKGETSGDYERLMVACVGE
ncbi:hypothetical protein NQ176_g5770 [Zarea fungicola]|uniref:Uncharacterized protein n=1 Tax=Zarea fungicola TaxID=93591 RepID=A0ACC1N7Z5_9HYPO|nr:hypothetical protein NQ176_g5770 [Lecanicillium fungicola]